MSLLDVSCLDLSPSLVAASATYIARYILQTTHPTVTFEQCWPQDLQIRSPYKTYQSLVNGIEILAKLIESYFSGNCSKEFDILFKRYEHEQLLKASLLCQQQRSLIQNLVG